MEPTNKLPIPSFGGSNLPVEGIGSLIEAGASVCNFVGGWIESNNNRDVRICQIINNASVIKNRDEKAYLNKCNVLAYMNNTTLEMIESDKFTAEEVIETVKEFGKWIHS